MMLGIHPAELSSREMIEECLVRDLKGLGLMDRIGSMRFTLKASNMVSLASLFQGGETKMTTTEDFQGRVPRRFAEDEGSCLGQT